MEGEQKGREDGHRRAAPVNLAALSRRQTLSQRVTRELTKSILRGDFPGGTFLPSESDLGQVFDVSRPVIREAVKGLAMLGLVTSRQGRGTTVAPSEQWSHFAPELLAARLEIGAVDEILLELLELRRIVEVEAAAIAVQRATEEDLSAMERILDAMEGQLDQLHLFTQSDIEFHDAILRATRNHLLPPLFEQLRPALEVARVVSLRTRPGGAAVSQEGHRAIFEAIRRRSAKAARDAMADHLSWTADLNLTDRDTALRSGSALRTTSEA